MSDGWVCEAQSLPVIKYFSATDQSQNFPLPIKCYKVDKAVQGFPFREWAAWYKLLNLLEEFPF